MNLNPNLNEHMDLIRHGSVDIIPEDDLAKVIEKSINNDQPLLIKCGCDPSRPDLHIGHSVVLKKLNHFQQLGHKAILLIGDFTAMIGDPTGRNKTRPQLSKEEIDENAKSYIEQSGKILDLTTLETVYNSHWLSKINFYDLIKLSSVITVARMLERDDFTKRYNRGKPISLHEFMYPLAQGYDSVHINADVELGGTDQTFNLLVGRDLQKEFKQRPQIAITTPLIEGTDGVEKMSKSYDNYIAFNDSPRDIYGKTMSIPDSLILKYYKYVSSISASDLLDIEKTLNSGSINPRDLKRKLARNLVAIFHSRLLAEEAQSDFDSLFIKNQIPDDVKEVEIKNETPILDFLLEHSLGSSKGDGKRLVNQGAVRINDEKVADFKIILKPKESLVIKVGKRRFIKTK